MKAVKELEMNEGISQHLTYYRGEDYIDEEFLGISKGDTKQKIKLLRMNDDIRKVKHTKTRINKDGITKEYKIKYSLKDIEMNKMKLK
jgi:hypothetical protein